jgi:hypothetical protein
MSTRFVQALRVDSFLSQSYHTKGPTMLSKRSPLARITLSKNLKRKLLLDSASRGSRRLRLEPQIPLKLSPHHAYKKVGMSRSKQACRWKRARAIA